MTINEQALWLHGEGFDMLGIVSLPPASTPAQRTGVVIVVGGAQYRAGSHRQFVQLARFLAEGGFPVLRFDLPGMGDSPGELPSFEDTAPHIATAIDGFQRQHPGVERVVLWGLCDGASASLLYVDATHDPRIAGLALLNPWVRSEVSLARARVKHYYWQRLREPEFWRKLLRGGIRLESLRSWACAFHEARSKGSEGLAFPSRMAQGWQLLDAPILLLLSQRDLTAQEFDDCLKTDSAWISVASSKKPTRIDITGADHTCSHPGAHQTLLDCCLKWLRKTHQEGDRQSPS
ncbi:hydrolase 1, exosortase A system-associated [Hydrogenophaga sp.]|uniref:hydrolase 1, exosortase A system-associated n=1 Tax=Hydrogenophaga sp. TaxID=1904254 RepID=UPI0027323259|nr:hydrolase 1, exosortase A system-associated [Hydrogenophaga sp.]MDP2986444.1 hydrolase 1, exosortase A system-associated [Hydrogenophaga sp.]